MSKDEEWKPVIVEGVKIDKYYVSNMGRIKKTRYKKPQYVEGNIKDKRIGINGTYYTVHHLIATAFCVKTSKDYKYVTHIDGNKSNNKAENLRWSIKKAHNNENQHKYPIIRTCVKTGEETEYSSVSECETKIHPSRGTIQRWCEDGKEHNGYTYKYKEEKDEIKSMEGEEWKKLKDSIYDDGKKFIKYEISNYGRLRTIDRKIKDIPKPNPYGYITYSIRCTEECTYEIHLLVLMAFNISRKNKDQIEVDHIDGNKLNNNLINLRWHEDEEENCKRNNNEESNEESKEGEKWKKLKDSSYEELKKLKKYEVSNYGNIRDSKTKSKLTDDSINEHGYIQYPLTYSQEYLKRIHRLVLMAFNIPRNDYQTEVDHIDTDKTNNRLDNLQWCTSKENSNNIKSKTNRNKGVKFVLAEKIENYDIGDTYTTWNSRKDCAEDLNNDKFNCRDTKVNRWVISKKPKRLTINGKSVLGTLENN